MEMSSKNSAIKQIIKQQEIQLIVVCNNYNSNIIKNNNYNYNS